jgi:hypothetical protein
MNYNEAVSMIQGALNAQAKDTYIPRRLILSVLKSKAEILMAQKFNDKSLFREINLFKWARCIRLEEIDTVNCGKIELQKCSSAMVSECELPELVWSRYGASILMVTNVLDEKEYTLITPADYINMRKKRGFEKFMGRYAILYPDGRIAIPDSTVKKINILLYSLDEAIDDKIDSMSDCGEENHTNYGCRNRWETEFNVTKKVRDAAIAEALKFLSIRMQIPLDANPNNDPNIKSREQ